MATKDPAKLIEVLSQLHTAMELFNGRLADEVGILEGQWGQLDSAWEGAKKDEFKDRWVKDLNNLREYKEKSKTLENDLHTHIDDLAKVLKAMFG